MILFTGYAWNGVLRFLTREAQDFHPTRPVEFPHLRLGRRGLTTIRDADHTTSYDVIVRAVRSHNGETERAVQLEGYGHHELIQELVSEPGILEPSIGADSPNIYICPIFLLGFRLWHRPEYQWDAPYMVQVKRMTNGHL